MANRYQQFLGARPGLVVELVDEATSPFTVRTEDGFEFSISAEDFRNYYREVGSWTPKKWGHLITDPDTGFVDAHKMNEGDEHCPFIRGNPAGFRKSTGICQGSDSGAW